MTQEDFIPHWIMENLDLQAAVACEVSAAVAVEEGVFVLAAVSSARDPSSFDAPGSRVPLASAAPLVVFPTQPSVDGDPPPPYAPVVLIYLQLMKLQCQHCLPVLFKKEH